MVKSSSQLVNRPFPSYLKPKASLSKRGLVHNHSYENEFNLHVNEISFSYERMSTKTRFEKETKGNSEMTYLHGTSYSPDSAIWHKMQLQYRSEISELRIRSLYAHTRMTIRVYAYDYTRIRVCLYAYTYFFVIHL